MYKIGIDARMYRSSTGGIGVFSQQLIKNLADLDYENEYYIFLAKKDLEEFDVKQRNFHPLEADIPHYGFGEQFVLPKILTKKDLDLVHFLNFNHPLFYSGKFITSIHDLTLIKEPAGKSQMSIFKRPFYKWILKDGIINSQAIFTISDQTKRDIKQFYNIDDKKINVIPLSIDKKRFQPKSQEEVIRVLKKYKIKKPYLLFVSQLRPHKGIDNLLSAFDLLKKEHRQKNLKLVIVGKDSGKYPKITKAIKERRSKGDLIAPGFVKGKDMAALYSGAEVFVFPSLYEGFGLPPLEAMACGTSVAASNRSCIPEVLEKAALYFDPQDPAEMASKINTLLINDKLADKLSMRGKKQVEKYSWQKTAQKTLQLYKKVIKT